MSHQDEPTAKLSNLNNNITLKELKESLKQLKSKKAPGIDNLNPEIIKCVKGNFLLDIFRAF